MLVDVVVRSHGEPVHGLKAGDFHVLEDGKPQTLTVFEEHTSADTVVASGPRPALPADTYSDAQPYTAASAVNVLLLDALNTPLSDQKYVRTRLLNYIKSIPPGTRVAVFTLGSHLRIIEGFTTDSDVILQALTEKRGRPETSPIMDPLFDQTLTNATDLATTALMQGGMLQFAAGTTGFEERLRQQITLDALTQLTRYLSTIPGRKNLLWVTGSLPFAVQLGTGGENTGGNTTPAENFTADFQDPVKKLEVLLTLARVAVYPIDAQGLMGTPSMMAETNPLPPNLMDSGIPTQAAHLSTFSNRMQAQDQAAMYAMAASHGAMDLFAQATGGKAFYNTNAIAGAVGSAMGIGANYYTLAYAPENRNYDGALRQVAVKVPEAHYDLAYRPGYFATNPAQTSKLISGRLTPLIAAMQHGSLPVCELPFTVQVTPASEDPVAKDAPAGTKAGGMLTGQLKGPVTRYVAEFRIDPAGVDFKALPNGGQHREIELTQVLYDPEGIRINYNDFGMGFDSPAQVSADAIHLSQQIDVPAGQSYLRLAVSDRTSGRMGVIEIPLNVKK